MIFCFHPYQLGPDFNFCISLISWNILVLIFNFQNKCDIFFILLNIRSIWSFYDYALEVLILFENSMALTMDALFMASSSHIFASSHVPQRRVKLILKVAQVEKKMFPKLKKVEKRRFQEMWSNESVKYSIQLNLYYLTIYLQLNLLEKLGLVRRYCEMD